MMRGYVPIWSLSSNFPRAAALTENALLCCLASMFKLLHKHWEEDVNLSFHKKSNFDLKDIVTNVLSGKWLQIWYTYLWILISDLLILGMLALWTSSSGFIKIKLYKIPRYVFIARHDFRFYFSKNPSIYIYRWLFRRRGKTNLCWRILLSKQRNVFWRTKNVVAFLNL